MRGGGQAFEDFYYGDAGSDWIVTDGITSSVVTFDLFAGFMKALGANFEVLERVRELRRQRRHRRRGGAGQRRREHHPDGVGRQQRLGRRRRRHRQHGRRQRHRVRHRRNHFGQL